MTRPFSKSKFQGVEWLGPNHHYIRHAQAIKRGYFKIIHAFYNGDGLHSLIWYHKDSIWAIYRVFKSGIGGRRYNTESEARAAWKEYRLANPHIRCYHCGTSMHTIKKYFVPGYGGFLGDHFMSIKYWKCHKCERQIQK